MKKEILIIDDDLGYISIVQKQLEQEGYNLFVASTKEEVKEKLENGLPDLILIDVQLNDYMGLKILKKLAIGYEKIKVMVITSVKEVLTIEKSFEYGAYDYVIKPFNIKDLANKISYALNECVTKDGHHV